MTLYVSNDARIATISEVNAASMLLILIAGSQNIKGWCGH
jgi:hypothetical protein